MALIINQGTAGATGSHSATGPTEIITSGAFGANSVQISVISDGAEEAPVCTFGGPGAVLVQAAAGTTINARVTGTNASLIDVAMNP